jgi:hypothetical protein
MGKATQDGGDDRLRFVQHEEEGESQREKKKYYISNDTSSRLFGLLKMRRFMIAMDSIESEESEREREGRGPRIERG